MINKLDFFLFSILVLVSCKHSQNKNINDGYFVNGVTWFATDNSVIEAHGGGFLKKDSVYYWYGEDHSKGHGNKTGISCYASVDLINWQNMGIALPKDSLPLEYRESGVCERPKVLYNQETKKYVMWMHLDADYYSHAFAGVAISDKPDGPYKLIRKFRPIDCRLANIKNNENTFRDMSLFSDNDGRSYVIYSTEGNATLYICQLNKDFTDIEYPSVEGKTWCKALNNEYREAPSLFKYKDKYFMITSGTTGWAPNAAKWHIAPSIYGPWRTIGNPCIGNESELTFRAQSTYVLPAPGKADNCFIFMADRWIGNKTKSGTYVWLPFVVQNDSISLQYIDKWKLGIFDNKQIVLDEPIISESNKILSWKKADVPQIFKIYKNGKEILSTNSNFIKLPDEAAGKFFNYYITSSNLFGKVSNPSNTISVEWDKSKDVWLSDISCDKNIQGYSTLQRDNSIGGGTLNINGINFNKGLGTNSYSEIVYTICCKYSKFESWVGIDNYHSDLGKGSAQFEIYGDNKLIFRSKILKINTPPEHILINIDKVNELKLVVTDAGDGIEYDHADWGNAKLILKGE